MKKHYYAALLMVALLLFPALQLDAQEEKKKISDEEKQKIALEIQDRLDGYGEALKNKDLEWYHSFWSNEPDFVFAGDGQVLTDYDAAVTQRFQGFFPQLKDVLYFEFTNGNITVLSKDAASYVANFEWSLLMNSGDTLQSKGSWLYVFKKANDQWSVVHSAGTHIQVN